MKNIKIYTIAILILLPFACKKDKFIDFQLNYKSSASIQPSTPLGLPFELLTPPVTTNSTSEFEGRNSKLSLINFVKLSGLKVEITSPQGKTFSFLKDIFIYIEADGLDAKLIAEKTNISDQVGGTLTLDIKDENLKEYIKKETFKIRVKAVTDETITGKIDFDIYSDFAVNTTLNK